MEFNICSLKFMTLSLQYRGPVSGVYLTPDNIRYLASNLHPTANIKSRLIHFSPGNENDLLIEIPLGPHDPRTVYVVTVGQSPKYQED